MTPRRSAGVAIVLLLSVWSQPGRSEVVNRIVATVDGEPITEHELRRYAQERGGNANVPESVLLDALITDRLLEKEIKAQGISAKDEEIARYMEEIQARNNLDAERFEKAIAGQGYTLAQYRAKVKSEIEKVALVNREIRARVNVTKEDVKRHYEAHKDEYEIKDRVRVRGILFSVSPAASDEEVARERQKAEEVRDLARKGKDFGALARQFSDGPGSDKDGDYGTFSRGEMEGELDAAAFSLEEGKVSDPLRTSAGFHVIRVEERISAGHRPVAEVEEEIRETLYNGALEDRFQNWLQRDLRERHHVELLSE
jgi:peptidyl-prolyl cis-trans isomerase SurA